MLHDNIFSYTLHGMELSSLLILNQVNFTKCAFANQLDDLEIFEEQDVFVGLSLEETFSSFPR